MNQTRHHYSYYETILYIFASFCLLLLVMVTDSEADLPTPVSECSIEAYERVAQSLYQNMALHDLRFGAPIFIRIFKESEELELWVKQSKQYALFKTYTICEYSGELGPKEKEGDKQSPEGFYTVGSDQMNPWSNFHLSFNLGFPNIYDQEHQRTGSALMVHGRCSSAGCFAMTDFRMDEIYTLADAALTRGQEKFAVHVFPFRMTENNLQRHSSSRWLPFWMNLKDGYDFFQQHRTPPTVIVEDGIYSFSTREPQIVTKSLKTSNGKS